ncbi:caspase family protein [Streptomyces mirabilis]|uniref:caspase family protein n=1 Tax=Streptomyces mirabilis TaxID=68239 RepID=UPI0039A440A0
MAILSDPSRSRAVLIGVHEYEDPKIENLPSIQASVLRLRELFVDPAVWGLPFENCTALLQPNRDEVFDAIHTATAQATDTLVIYYIGHGLLDPDFEELHLALPDSSLSRLDKSLRYNDIRRVVLSEGSMKKPDSAPRRVVILDCCWSGRALGMMAGGRVSDGTDIEGAFVLTATSRTKKAQAPPGRRYTAFSGELISIMEGGIAGAPPLLNMRFIYQQLRKSLAVQSFPQPEQRNSAMAGDICVVRNRSESPGPPSDIPPFESGLYEGYAAVLTSWWAEVDDALNRQGLGPMRAGVSRYRDRGGLFANNLAPEIYSLRSFKAAFSRKGLMSAGVVRLEFARKNTDMDRLVAHFTQYALVSGDLASVMLLNRASWPRENHNKIRLLRHIGQREPSVLADVLRRSYIAAPLRTHDMCAAADIPTPPMSLTHQLRQLLQRTVR